jgi:hypothetical protein
VSLKASTSIAKGELSGEMAQSEGGRGVVGLVGGWLDRAGVRCVGVWSVEDR